MSMVPCVDYKIALPTSAPADLNATAPAAVPAIPAMTVPQHSHATIEPATAPLRRTVSLAQGRGSMAAAFGFQRKQKPS